LGDIVDNSLVLETAQEPSSTQSPSSLSALNNFHSLTLAVTNGPIHTLVVNIIHTGFLVPGKRGDEHTIEEWGEIGQWTEPGCS
jgi:hypothetical protein